jgi:hypothetical protein
LILITEQKLAKAILLYFLYFTMTKQSSKGGRCVDSRVWAGIPALLLVSQMSFGDYRNLPFRSHDSNNPWLME